MYIDSFVNSAAIRFRSACAAVRPVQWENVRLRRENLFSIFRGYTDIRPDVRDGVSESVSRNCGSYYREKYFWINPRFQSGSAARPLKGNRAEASMMKMYVTKCRKRVQARKFRVDVCRGCEAKCNCLAGRHFCNNFMRAVSIVRIRKAIILVEVVRNFGLLIKTISREEFKGIMQSQLDRDKS